MEAEEALASLLLGSPKDIKIQNSCSQIPCSCHEICPEFVLITAIHHTWLDQVHIHMLLLHIWVHVLNGGNFSKVALTLMCKQQHYVPALVPSTE